MVSINPPLTKEDFINSGWKEVIDSSERKECRSYSDAFYKKFQEAENAGKIREKEVFAILQCITFPAIKPESNDKCLPECFQQLTEEHLNFLAEIVSEVSDPELQARIADILWVREHKDKHKMALLAVKAYLDSATQLEDPQKWSCCVDRLGRALKLAKRINNQLELEVVVTHIDAVLDRYKAEDPLWLSVKLMELLIDCKLGDAEKYAELAEKGAKWAETNCEWEKVRNYWEIKTEWHRIEKNAEKAYKTRMLLAETYVKEAQDSLTKHPTPYLKAAYDLKKAFEAFESLKSQGTEEERELINNRLEEIHKLLLDYQQKSLNELITISDEVNISNEVKLAKAKVKGKKFPDTILILALLGTPSKISDLRQSAEETARLSGFFPIVKMNEMGKVIAHQPTTANEVEESIRFEMYMRAVEYQKIHAQAFIEPARYQIISEHKIEESDLIPLVLNSPFVPEGRENLFAKGLYAGLMGDFVTATHILIPQIENSVRHLLFKRGAITSGIDNKNNGIQKENDLNSSLRSSKYPEITSIFDEDTLLDLQGLLVEHYGSNLRNKMAHGLIDNDEFSSPIFSYLWWVALRLCFGIGIKIPEQIVEETNPWVKFAGIFKDDPLFDEFVEEMAANRRELDAEIAAEEASLEEYKTA